MEMNCFVVDTFAWIEYFKGSASGLEVLDLIKGQRNELFTPITALSELKDYCERQGKNFEEIYIAVRSNSSILELGGEDAIEAGKNHFEMKKKMKNWGYMDSFILAALKKMQKIHKKAKIVTGDEHFRQFPFTIWIK